MTNRGFLVDLGLREYKEVWDLQRELVECRIARDVPDVLILVEHPHVITVGRKGSTDNVLSRDLPCFHVERGGDATYHGPGQLVGYPILSLGHEKHDIIKYLRDLEEAIILTVGHFGVKANRGPQTGVWVGEKKLASIGIAVHRWVTYHGFALNVNTDLRFFDKIRPCGLKSSTMTSMKEILKHELDIDSVKGRLMQSFQEVFRCELKPVEAPRLLEIARIEAHLRTAFSSYLASVSTYNLGRP